MKYNAHVNVEICATVKSIKYLFKYIYKGHDCANIKLQRPVQEGAAVAQATLEWDEIKAHLDARYPVYFAEGNERQALERAATKDMKLTAWFKLNSKNPDARQYLYHDIPHHFVFDDLKTVDDQVCQTFMEAAKRRGLLRDDTEYTRCMAEAVMFQMPQQLRTLFCVIHLHCNPTKPIDLWNLFKAHMAKDFMQHVNAHTAEAMAFYAIEEKLQEQGRSCSDLGIP
ncbi:unnamed protein product [Rotaria sp. Silwood2]|nr:unnamed protein product [Rotaria sp. Silwood2]